MINYIQKNFQNFYSNNLLTYSKEKMKYRVTSDTHFNHHSIMLKIGRPSDYEERIYKGLKSIPKEDILIHMGDICIGQDEEQHNKYIATLKCKKILVLGNHDHKSYTWYYQHGRDFVCERFDLSMYGYHLIFTHKPMDESILEGDMINIHGHVHQRHDYQTGHNRILFAQEERGYRPWNLLTLIRKDGFK